MEKEIPFNISDNNPAENENSAEIIVEEYLRLLGLKRENLIGKKILDVGVETDEFAEACKKIGLNAEIYSVDKSNTTGPSADPINRTGKYIKANALAMPFEDASFDLVISAFALPIMAQSQSNGIENSIKEMLRVTKNGGELIFMPILGVPTFYDGQGKLITDPDFNDRANDNYFIERVDATINQLAAQGNICLKELVESEKRKKLAPAFDIYKDQDVFRIKIKKKQNE